MEWLQKLLFEEGVANSILIISLVTATGLMLGKIRIGGISLGVTWILFAGIALGHFGMSIEHHTLGFVREFGLILFVYSVGLQVGPGFFSSFRKGGLTLNVLATGIVFLGVLTTYMIHLSTGLPLTTMVGILSGAVTNTPGLGAAQQAYVDMTGVEDKTIALGYAVAYPLGVIGIIGSIMVIRYIFRIKLDRETETAGGGAKNGDSTGRISLVVRNPAIYGMAVCDITSLIEKRFVISRIERRKGDQGIELVHADTTLNEGDKILVVAESKNLKTITAFIGEKIEMNWDVPGQKIVSHRAMVTKSGVNGKTLGQLKLRSGFEVNITRIERAGLEFIAHPDLILQLGDKVTIVGSEMDVKNVERILGNSMRRLDEPNLIPIFIGILMGVLLGSLPFTFPGIPQPVKLGLAGGPLVVAILLSYFGPKFSMVTYTTLSANLMLREIGISLFLAAVGLGAGKEFISTIVYGGGYAWIGYGVMITVIPVLLIGIIARTVFKINYFTIMGLLAGSTTDPPALAYSNTTAGNDIPAVSYATVYPLTMFLRVLSAQLLILFAT